MLQFLSRPFQFYPGYIATKCCHHTKRKGLVIASQCVTDHAVSTLELRSYIRMPLNKSGQVDWCLECIGKMAIPCAWCRKPIFIGDPITLYSYTKSEKPADRQRVMTIRPEQKEGNLHVGCLRMNCADSGADRAGFWVPGDNGKGAVYRIPTLYEMILRGGKNDGAIVVNDLSNMREAVRMANHQP